MKLLVFIIIIIIIPLTARVVGAQTRERISCILELREKLLSIQTGFSLVNAAVVFAILESISGFKLSSFITQASVHSLWSLCLCHWRLLSSTYKPSYQMWVAADGKRPVVFWPDFQSQNWLLSIFPNTQGLVMVDILPQKSTLNIIMLKLFYLN